MRQRLPLVLAVTALVVAVLGSTTTPAIAHGVRHALFAHNADKVDGKHAVTANATVANRRGKLVATSAATGRLPDNIIAKAPDSNLLDGLEASAFLGAGAKAADAELLDGLEANAFQTGGGSAIRTFLSVPSNDIRTVTTPFSQISYTCPTSPGAQVGTVSYTNTFGGLAPAWIEHGATVTQQSIGVAPATQTTSTGADHVTIAAVHGLQPDRTVLVDVFSVHQGVTCLVYVHAVST